jgi:hypothetical protein
VSVAFYMDEHVPNSITVGLRIRGVDVLTAQDDGRGGEGDPFLLDRAAELNRVMFSFDADMLREADTRQRRAVPFAGLVFAHPVRIPIGQCVRDLEIVAKAADPSELVDQVVYLPL